MIRWLRRLLCDHPHTIRERDSDGTYWLVCRCGHRARVERLKLIQKATTR